MAKRRFKTLDDLRRYAADVVNRLEGGKLDEMQAKSRMYCVNVLSGVIRDSELENRVNALETALAPTNPNRPGARAVQQEDTVSLHGRVARLEGQSGTTGPSVEEGILNLSARGLGAIQGRPFVSFNDFAATLPVGVDPMDTLIEEYEAARGETDEMLRAAVAGIRAGRRTRVRTLEELAPELERLRASRTASMPDSPAE